LNNTYYIIGIDGGGTNTKVCLFNNKGQTILEISGKGTNLSVYKKLAIDRLIDLLNNISNASKIPLDEVSAFGFGLAGVSDENQRESLLKELDRIGISSNSIILSDSEIAFHLLCPIGTGLLLCIGTGIVCLGRSSEGENYKVAGKGHDEDIGSGYWIGKQAIDRVILNLGLISADKDINEIYTLLMNSYNLDNIDNLYKIFENSDSIAKIASITENIIELAENGNDIALSIIQEATRNVGEYIMSVLEKLNYNNKDLIFAGHGSVLKNIYFRKLLNQALEFDIKNIHWVLSDISPAFSAGIIAGASKNINVSIEKIVKNMKN